MTGYDSPQPAGDSESYRGTKQKEQGGLRLQHQVPAGPAASLSQQAAYLCCGLAWQFHRSMAKAWLVI
jgi:hypothetical protein